MEKLIEILKELKPQIDFDENTKIAKDKIFDSLDMVSLVAQLSDEFDIDITAPYITPENFESVSTIYSMIQKIEQEDD